MLDHKYISFDKAGSQWKIAAKYSTREKFVIWKTLLWYAAWHGSTMVIPDTAATICTTYKCRTRNGTLYSCACICCPTRILGQVCSKSSRFAQGHLVVFVAFLNWALTTAEFIMFAFCLLDVLLCMVTICIVFLTRLLNEASPRVDASVLRCTPTSLWSCTTGPC